MANYGRELRMGEDIRRKGKMEKVTEFVEKLKRVQEEAGAALMSQTSFSLYLHNQ